MEKDLQPTTIIFTGPESTGKTTLASILSQGYDEPLVKELARGYLENTHGKYEYEDLENITKLQNEEERKQRKKSERILFCDTDELTIITWGIFRFGKINEWILQSFLNKDAIYVVCGIDVPWTPDPLRENPNDREELYNLHIQYLQQANKHYLEVTGTIEERIHAITSFLDTKNL